MKPDTLQTKYIVKVTKNGSNKSIFRMCLVLTITLVPLLLICELSNSSTAVLLSYRNQSIDLHNILHLESDYYQVHCQLFFKEESSINKSKRSKHQINGHLSDRE